MKITESRFAIAVLAVLFAISLSNCAVSVEARPTTGNAGAKRLPPGQAKKIYGGKSAKNYAPGHNKD